MIFNPFIHCQSHIMLRVQNTPKGAEGGAEYARGIRNDRADLYWPRSQAPRRLGMRLDLYCLVGSHFCGFPTVGGASAMFVVGCRE